MPIKAVRTGAEGRPQRARVVPSQKRSRERFERILACAAEVIVEKGGDVFRMSDIVERTGVGFGSLYQYFPDRSSIIGALAERCNAIGRACVQAELETVKGPQDLHPALCRMTDAYFRMFLEQPLMRQIWRATQSDDALRALDEEDGAALAQMVLSALRRIAPDRPAREHETLAPLIIVLMAAAVRHAIALSPEDGQRALSLFKRLLLVHPALRAPGAPH